MKVYALIGPSGTGKSHRALKIAYENSIDYIIDDGILIYKTKILAGRSAKNANTKMEAVRRAIFEEDDHRDEIVKAIADNDVNRLLLIGTSEKMVEKIIKRLGIGSEYEKISIFDIASAQEIEEAIKMRKNCGIHVVPIPTFEMKRHFSGILKNPIKLMFSIKGSGETRVFEKTLIRPNFSYLGKFFISERAIVQISRNEIYKFNEVKKIFSVDTVQSPSGIQIDVTLGMRMCRLDDVAHKIQKAIAESVEGMTLINANSININIMKIYIELKK